MVNILMILRWTIQEMERVKNMIKMEKHYYLREPICVESVMERVLCTAPM